MKWSHGFTVAPGPGFYKKSRHSVGGAKDLPARKTSTPVDDVTNVSLFRFSKPVALDTDTPTTLPVGTSWQMSWARVLPVFPAQKTGKPGTEPNTKKAG